MVIALIATIINIVLSVLILAKFYLLVNHTKITTRSIIASTERLVNSINGVFNANKNLMELIENSIKATMNEENKK